LSCTSGRVVKVGEKDALVVCSSDVLVAGGVGVDGDPEIVGTVEATGLEGWYVLVIGMLMLEVLASDELGLWVVACCVLG